MLDEHRGASLPDGLVLLPHERWVAERYFRYRVSRPEFLESAINTNRGPKGIALLGAALAWGLPGVTLVVVGIVLLLVTGGAGAAYGVLGVGIVLTFLGFARSLQADAVGRKFRGGRPMRREGGPFG